jgi:hypothetical protein
MFPTCRGLSHRRIGGILDELIEYGLVVLACVNNMAIVFGLSAHFGVDETAADRFIAQIKQRYRSFPIDPQTIDLHSPKSTGIATQSPQTTIGTRLNAGVPQRGSIGARKIAFTSG